MFVKGQGGKQAVERQATFLKAQAAPIGQLTNIDQAYDEMLHKDWDLATEQQKLRVEALKLKLQDPDLAKNKLEDFM